MIKKKYWIKEELYFESYKYSNLRDFYGIYFEFISNYK